MNSGWCQHLLHFRIAPKVANEAGAFTDHGMPCPFHNFENALFGLDRAPSASKLVDKIALRAVRPGEVALSSHEALLQLSIETLTSEVLDRNHLTHHFNVSISMPRFQCLGIWATR